MSLPKAWGYLEVLTSTDLNTQCDYIEGALVPIGSIIPFYDFDGALTFDSSYWAYCNGQSKTVGGSSRTLPDMSNRYPVGFGDEGSGNIGTATWATAAVGNASHQVALVNHTHAPGTLQFKTFEMSGGIGQDYKGYESDGTATQIYYQRSDIDTSGGGVATNLVGGQSTQFYTKDGTGVTGNTVSATQSIQPRSIRVRFIMRIL
jgi:hypothetical protein